MSARRIDDYALIGDLETAALVARDGTIEWLCFPRFDSDACCAALLGDRENGCWEIMLGEAVTHTSRRYRDDTLILETDLVGESGSLRIIDFMPVRGHAPDVVRIVECLDGQVELTSELRLRFDYGRIHPLVETAGPSRCLAVSGPSGVSLDFDDPIEFENRRFTTRASLRKGERRCFVLTWYPSHEDPPERVDPVQALEQTERFWTDWVGGMDYQGDHRPAVVRSLITLKAMTYRPTGGIVAAPTASLPENPGGTRNWDYRYCWLRDATFTLLALIGTGMTHEAAAWIDWLRRAAGGEPIDLQPFYSVTGDPRAIEWEADWLSGFDKAKPVRFGNGAQGQLQLDIYGEVIDAIGQAHAHGLCRNGDADLLVRRIADRVRELWREPDAGLWESRGEPRHYTYSKVMCWVALDRAARWFDGHDDDLAQDYRSLADEVRALVLDKGWNERRGCLTRAFDDPQMDAALLRLPLLGFLPVDDERMAATIAAVERELCVDGLLRRYDTGRTEDGVEGGEGAFVAACFWLVEVMLLQGRTNEASTLFDRILGRANDLGLLAEELDTASSRQLGNFPQALSHLGLVRTAVRLTDARKRNAEDKPEARRGANDR